MDMTMNCSNVSNIPPVIGRIELHWQKLANRLAAQLPSIHFDGGSDFTQTTDEFLIRQLLREIVIDTLSSSFVVKKETKYPDSKERLDLQVGAKNAPNSIAFEIKGDSATIDSIKSDWAKLLRDDESDFRMSVFAGVCSKEKYQVFVEAFSSEKYKVFSGEYAHTMAEPAFNFAVEKQRGIKKEFVAFTWIWSVGKDAKSLPRIQFDIVGTQNS